MGRLVERLLLGVALVLFVGVGLELLLGLILACLDGLLQLVEAFDHVVDVAKDVVVELLLALARALPAAREAGSDRLQVPTVFADVLHLVTIEFK